MITILNVFFLIVCIMLQRLLENVVASVKCTLRATAAVLMHRHACVCLYVHACLCEHVGMDV